MEVFIIVAAIVALLILLLSLPAGTPAIRRKGRNRSAKSIVKLEKLSIGGSDQWVLERSEDINNPVILFLHGGPGTSQLTSNRRNTKDLERFFIAVNWDQRGAGKSYKALKDVNKMNINQFVEDTRELTLYLLKKFNKKRIILAGHSWGSVIAVLTVSKYPGLYYSYVGIGQLANMAAGEAASWRWTLEQARRRKDSRAIKTLEKMGPPPYKSHWQANTFTQRKHLSRFGGEIHGSKMGAFGLVMRDLVFSREYTFTDRLNYLKGVFGSMKLLWPQLMNIDLFSTSVEIKIPVFLIEGRFDHECPSTIASEYFDSLEAPSKELIWFEKSAHLPNFEERDLFNRIIIDKVLPTAVNLDIPREKLLFSKSLG